MAGAVKAFPQIASYAGPGEIGHGLLLALTIPAQAFLAAFHRSPAGRDGHGAVLSAEAAVFALIPLKSEGEIHMTIPA